MGEYTITANLYQPKMEGGASTQHSGQIIWLQEFLWSLQNDSSTF